MKKNTESLHFLLNCTLSNKPKEIYHKEELVSIVLMEKDKIACKNLPSFSGCFVQLIIQLLRGANTKYFRKKKMQVSPTETIIKYLILDIFSF